MQQIKLDPFTILFVVVIWVIAKALCGVPIP